MAFDNRRTYLAYSNRDLIRDGFIPTFIEKEYIPVDTFNIRRLKSPPKGVTYVVGRDKNGNIISVKERKKLLPASKIKVEIDFSKVMKNAVSHPFSPGSLSFSPIAGMVAIPLLAPIGFGGITSGLTEFTFHILEAREKINTPITITQEILDTGVLQFDGYPLSIFGIVKEHIEGVIGDMSDPEIRSAYLEEHPTAKIVREEVSPGIFVYNAHFGLDFKKDQLDVIGKYSDGVWKGTRRKRIDGATDDAGLFGGAGDAEIKIVSTAGESGDGEDKEVLLYLDQKQLFIEIIKDRRKLKFRGDNFDALGGGEYPFAISGAAGIDVTDKQIRINTTDLILDDIIYITYSITVGDRHLRQNIEHQGKVAQGNTVGVIGFVGAIASDVDAFDYRIHKWKVTPLPFTLVPGEEPVEFPMENIDQITEQYSKDEDYKLTLNDFIVVENAQREADNTGDAFSLVGQASEIEGWRLSEAILWRKLEQFFTADHRGILYFNRNHVTLLFPRSFIRDQNWFTEYLQSLSFIKATGPVDPDDPIDEEGNPKKTFLPTDYQKDIEDYIDLRDLPGFLFDTSEIINSVLFDREKIHYHRSFANALKKVSKYVEGEDEESLTTGIGIVHLDLLPLICPSITTIESTETIKGETVTHKRYGFSGFSVGCGSSELDLRYYDLSYGIFDSVNAQPRKIDSCLESFDIHDYNYFSMNYDAMNDGPGAWYDQGFIMDDVFEWRPDGGSLESYWKLETPYYCGSFSTSSRVYIEKMGGNSLDNFSWIYIDTADPFIPHNISSDTNYNFKSSVVVFDDNFMHKSLCYHRINEEDFENSLSLVKLDKTKNHIRDTYEHTVDGNSVTEFYDHDKNFLIGQNRILGNVPTYSNGIPITDEVFKICQEEGDIKEKFWTIINLMTDPWPNGAATELSFSDSPPRTIIPFNYYIDYLEIKFKYEGTDLKDIDKYISFYFEETESSISNIKVSELVLEDEFLVMRIDFNYYHGGYFQFLGKFWEEVEVNKVNARIVQGNDESLDPPQLNADNYKIEASQSAAVYDRLGRIMVFYSNEDTNNIDVAISYDNGDNWIRYTNLIRLVTGEAATVPFVIKDSNTKMVHLFYVLNDAFLMYKKINTDAFMGSDALVDYEVPEAYEPGDYDLTLDDPERDFWGNYTEAGLRLRREPSYFVEGFSKDQYFIDQMKIIEDIDSFNSTLSSSDASKAQTQRFLFYGDEAEMRNIFKSQGYAVYLSDDGVLRLFFISNEQLSIKRSSDYFQWQYDISDQIIHKNYIDEQVNKGFPEGISNIQIVRDDFNKSIVSVLYFHNEMLFIRHFYTNLLFPRYDSDDELQNRQMERHLEVTDEDLTVDPIKKRTKHVPVFLVGVIPEEIKKTLKDDIQDGIKPEDSDLFIYFPYKDPDEPNNVDKNKEMVDRFGENLGVDAGTQVYAVTTARGLIRVFYKDPNGNINGIIIDSLRDPTLEVMNVFKDV